MYFNVDIILYFVLRIELVGSTTSCLVEMRIENKRTENRTTSVMGRKEDCVRI